ncbi:histidine kinase [Microbacterium sp. 2FI]|uniref:sensor histidine kinase n=1 Tax=Microbacterium sp. 2FI TaxID=2502193 RepID=UPI0010F450FB|nr:histidine kinase [Microbacterium sp. 2FI]
MLDPVRALWCLPAATPLPPRRVWRDWVLVGVVPALAVFEAALRPELPHRWLMAALLAGGSVTLLWRRTRPLAMLCIAFGLAACGVLINGATTQSFTSAYFLILVYAVMRWGSGRALVLGAAVTLASTAWSLIAGPTALADVIGGLAVMITTSALGIAFRLRASARERQLESLRLREREELARDLHDTVAHHVSAIAIQAQAGRAVAAADPEAAITALRTIEAEAGRALDDLRAMVRVLRHDDDARRAPVAGIADIAQLVDAMNDTPTGITARFDMQGDPAAVPPAVGLVAYRIAQEALTNTRRHAHGATRVDVTAAVDAAAVRLEVRDDGHVAPGGSSRGGGYGGYGIAGMLERARLVGGICEVGPHVDDGWVVAATLPKAGTT